MSEYIGSVLGRKTVAEGVTVTYTLENYTETKLEDGDAPQYLWNWSIRYHYLDDDGKDSEFWHKKKDDAGHSIENSTIFTRKWDKSGRHLIECVAKSRSTGKFVKFVSFEQQVAPLEAILERQMEQARAKKLPNPHAELTMMWKWLIVLDKLGKQQASQMTETQNFEHGSRIRELERNAEALKALLAKYDDATIRPIRAVYLAKESMEEKELRVFVAQPNGVRDRIVLVDWTNPLEPKLHGEYEAKFKGSKGKFSDAEIIRNGIKDAIEEWEDDNEYWPGGIRYEVDYKHNGERIALSGSIKTGDTSWKEDLAGVLKKIAAGAAVIGLVLTGVGSTLAGAMIVTSMVAGTTGAVLSIQHRHSKGTGNFMDDAQDVLDIAANVLGVGYRAGKAVMWQAGRTVRLKLADKVLDAMFIGEVWADGFNGMLLGMDFVKRYNEIISSKTMMPEERANALLGLFRDAAASGAMHGLNNKVASVIEEAKWPRLLEKNSTPDNLVDPPSFPAHTKDQKKEVTVVNKQQRQEPAGVTIVSSPPPPPKPAKPQQPKFPPNDPAIFKHYKVTDSRIELQTHDGYHFTADIDHNGYVTLDVQTRVNDKHSPHLGTGSENYARMFQHFEANGHQINGWHGMFVQDNYKQIQSVKSKNPGMTDEDAVFESVSGRKFWKPWAASKKPPLKIVIEDARDIRGGMFVFSVRFERPKAKK